MRRKKVKRIRCICIGRILAAVVLIFGISSIAAAFEIPTGNDNFQLRWDNSLRYNYGVRAKETDSALIANPNFDDGNRNFDNGTVTNRVDILSELDFRIKGDYGFRFSGAGWYDQRYHDALGNDSLATSNHIHPNGQQALGLGGTTERYFAGPSGELLDAFAFGTLELGEVPVNIKVGRHTIYWGEGLLFIGAVNGISYSQFPIDAAKGFATPGTGAKELFRPLFNVSAQAQVTNTFTVAGQYFLEWEPYRFPEAGSFLSPADLFLEGSESMIVGPGAFFMHGSDQEPDGKKDFGVKAQWGPEWLGGTAGLYYRRFTDKLPQVHLDLGRGEFLFAYADSIDLYGVSLSKEIMGISVGLEGSYRHNMPLVSSAAIVGASRLNDGETLGARGDTQHAVINFLGLLSKTPLWDTASWAIECTYSRWDKVNQGEQYFLGRDGYNAIDRPTKDAVAVAAQFIPTWFNAFPGMNLTMPLNYSSGIYGTSAVLFGDNTGAGNASVGLCLDVYQRYNFSLTYNTYFGDYSKDSTGALSAYRGSQALLSDRDYIAFTIKFSL